MRGEVPACEVRVPASLAQALAFLAEEPGRWRPLAGGTDLMVPFAAGRLEATRFLSLHRLDELRGLEEGPESLTLGALTTFTALRRAPAVQRWFPNLVRSARVTGALAIQNRGTLGGNLVNASPAADTPPALLAYGARVELTSLRGARWVPLQAFHTGYRRTLLAPDELLTRIQVPKPRSPGFHYYRKVDTRAAQAVAKVCLAGHLQVEHGVVTGVGLGWGSVAPVPTLAVRAGAVLLGARLEALPVVEACAELIKELSPIEDLRSTARYRLTVAQRLLESLLLEGRAAFGSMEK